MEDDKKEEIEVQASSDEQEEAQVSVEASQSQEVAEKSVQSEAVSKDSDTSSSDEESETIVENAGGADIQVIGEASEEDENLRWYVVHTYSGYEQKARLALKERVRQQKMLDKFSKVLIPSENVIELVRGQKKTTSRKFFPGYMLVQMILDDNSWHLVKGTARITGFVGNALNPPPVPEEEVARITTQMQEGTLRPRPKVEFEEGESVRVIDGPFVNFNGVVEEVKPDKGKLRVMVSIFGRSTPVELDFVQVEKN